jgi:hypothetical protein
MVDEQRRPRRRHVRPDEALGRLEDVLLGLPFDRAVPDLAALLAAAGVDEAVLHDERVLKLLHEALVARPFGSFDAVQHVRTEVELLTLETELLTDRLAAPATDAGSSTRSARGWGDPGTPGRARRRSSEAVRAIGWPGPGGGVAAPGSSVPVARRSG